jgi:predicted HTH domain antitoxin
MTYHIEISDEQERWLQEAFGGDLSRAALEALAIQGYRAGKLGWFQVGRLLGISDRWDVERWLADRKVDLNYGKEDLEEDRRTIDELLRKSA